MQVRTADGKGKLFSKIPMFKYYFQTKSFFKNNLLVKLLKHPFCSPFFWLKTNIFLPWKKICNIDYSSSLRYLINVNWLYISCKVTKKVIWEQQTKWLLLGVIRSSRPEVFCEKGVLRNFTKHLCQSLFFNKVAGLRPATLLKKNFVKFIRTHFYTEHLWWLILCYWKFNTEVAISEFFEKLYHLSKGKLSTKRENNKNL